jgi:hypothetical protein
MSIDEEKTHLKQLCCHIVVLAGSYQLKNKPEDTLAFSYSGCILTNGKDWIWATAGHCFQNLEAAMNHIESKSFQCWLVDYFGASATHKDIPVPFNPLDYSPLWIDQDWIDFGFVVLPNNVKKCLEKNGILPLTNVNHTPAEISLFEGFTLVGIPDEWRTPVILQGKFEGASIRPCLLPIGKVSNLDNRLEGKILHKGNLDSVVGMSGGPLFGYRTQGGQITYELVGFQQSWDKKETVYVTPWRGGWDTVTQLPSGRGTINAS